MLLDLGPYAMQPSDFIEHETALIKTNQMCQTTCSGVKLVSWIWEFGRDASSLVISNAMPYLSVRQPIYAPCCSFGSKQLTVSFFKWQITYKGLIGLR